MLTLWFLLLSSSSKYGASRSVSFLVTLRSLSLKVCTSRVVFFCYAFWRRFGMCEFINMNYNLFLLYHHFPHALCAHIPHAFFYALLRELDVQIAAKAMTHTLTSGCCTFAVQKKYVFANAIRLITKHLFSILLIIGT